MCFFFSNARVFISFLFGIIMSRYCHDLWNDSVWFWAILWVWLFFSFKLNKIHHICFLSLRYNFKLIQIHLLFLVLFQYLNGTNLTNLNLKFGKNIFDNEKKNSKKTVKRIRFNSSNRKYAHCWMAINWNKNKKKVKLKWGLPPKVR